jgi:hypothetical protein
LLAGRNFPTFKQKRLCSPLLKVNNHKSDVVPLYHIFAMKKKIIAKMLKPAAVPMVTESGWY